MVNGRHSENTFAHASGIGLTIQLGVGRGELRRQLGEGVVDVLLRVRWTPLCWTRLWVSSGENESVSLPGDKKAKRSVCSG